jgi:omega-6 fatty acid desaturase (delta-12 desaturase)
MWPFRSHPNLIHDKPSFYALWRSFSQCLFVEEEGDIVFYKDRNGNAARIVAEDALQE